mmetsp:Transcript_20441/g.16889  ORF Transcript_20441/g.16889 Transcript_20441/m.16889 type:complete len:81 (-) Transcript_20441:84-326(-)
MSKKENSDMNIEFLFQHMDKDNSGTVTTEELKMFLADNDIAFLEIDSMSIMTELDKNKDGVITIDEFKESYWNLMEKLEN